MQNKYPFELSALKSSNVPMATVQRGDVVKIADSDLDWLQSFYNNNFDGNPIKLFSERFAISVLNDMKNAPNKNDRFLFLVRAIDGGKFIQVDMYQKSVGDRVLWTEVLDNSKPMSVINGHFHMESYSIHRDGGLMPYSSDVAAGITTYISDVVHYVIFYMQENINNPEYVTKTATTTTQTTGGKKNKKGKKKTTRSTMYVPRRITTNVNTATTGAAQATSSSVGQNAGAAQATSSSVGQNASAVQTTGSGAGQNTSNVAQATGSGAVQNTSNVAQATGNGAGQNTSNAVQTTAGSTGQPTALAGSTTADERTYHVAQWPTRAYKRTITHKDGTTEVIDVSASTHKRDPKLMKRSKGKNGVDIKLRPRKP